MRDHEIRKWKQKVKALVVFRGVTLLITGFKITINLAVILDWLGESSLTEHHYDVAVLALHWVHVNYS